MRMEQSLKVYELVKDQIKKPEEARALTDSIQKVISEPNKVSQNASASSIGKELEWLRRRLSKAFHTEIQAQNRLFLKVALIITVLLVAVLLAFHINGS